MTRLVVAAAVAVSLVSVAAVASMMAAPAPAPISLGALYIEGDLSPVVSGSIDLDQVTKEVERHLPDLADCYSKQLRDTPELEGEVLIHFAIDTEGDFMHACITRDTVEDSAVRACVNELVAAGDYPPANGQPVDVTVPFNFTPQG